MAWYLLQIAHKSVLNNTPTAERLHLELATEPNVVFFPLNRTIHQLQADRMSFSFCLNHLDEPTSPKLYSKSP